MNRVRIHHMGSQPMNGNDAYTVLGIVGDWLEEQDISTPDPHEILNRLRSAGYCFCTTEFGCVACNGRKDPESLTLGL